MPVCMCVGLATGFLTGGIVKQIKGPSVARTFSDSIFWKVSLEGGGLLRSLRCATAINVDAITVLLCKMLS